MSMRTLMRTISIKTWRSNAASGLSDRIPT